MGDPRAQTHVDRWHAYVHSHDHQALWNMLHEEAVFESPVVHTPQRGRDIVWKYLTSADKVLGGPGFRYVGQWLAADSAVLEFENEVEGLHVNGIDMIRWDADGRIVHFKVMVRPLKAVNLLHRMMGEMLARQPTAAD
ncbi:MAG: nuclear transport factor 2 family protein [Thermaurantiacus sp.]